jgi:DNA-binding CsgD family transcriptional regulator
MSQYQALISLDGLRLSANQAVLALTGSRVRDAVGLPAWRAPWYANSPSASDKLERAVRSVKRYGVEHRSELTLKLPAGILVVQCAVQPVTDVGGNLIAMMINARDRDPLLNKRESEVLQWVAAGKTADEIAVILGISRRTAEWHIQNIRQKLSAGNTAHAVAIAIRRGLTQ